MKSKKKLRSCFLVTSMNIDVQPLWNILEQRNIKRIGYFLESSYGNELSLKIEEAIHKADFIFAVLDSRASNKNVYFELGIAFGKNKPIFLVTDSNEGVPLLLKDIFFIKATFSDFEAIKYNLDIFLEHSKATRKAKTKTTRRSSKKRFSAELLFDNVKRAQSERDLENVLRDAFKRAGYQVDKEVGAEDKLVDMAVWIDQIQSAIGNPVLVELKAGLLTENRINDGLQQLRVATLNSGGRIGLLIYKDERGQRFPFNSNKWPLIIALSVDEFLEMLSNGNLPKYLITQRNRFVHGPS